MYKDARSSHQLDLPLHTVSGDMFGAEGRQRQFLFRFKLSIRQRILAALLIVMCLMSIPYIVLIASGLQYKRQYDLIIENTTTASSINGHVKPLIDAEMWDVVAGKKSFDQGDQYAILDDVTRRIQQMIENTDSQQGKLKLEVTQRTIDTLRGLIDQIGVQIQNQATFEKNMVLLEQVRLVSQLVEDNVQEYTLFEVDRTEQQYRAMQASLDRWAISSLMMIGASIMFSVAAAWYISRSIYIPIKKLHDVTTTIARQDLEVLMTAQNADEIAQLGMSFNLIVGRMRELLDAKIKEQETLKKAELRALQAQINPHFLYNTLEAIIWMAEANRKTQVVELVHALSRFFRITLSKGKDWITVGEEFAHVESYLTIQQMRYRDILDYRIEMPQNVLDGKMLKLTLQPLVENALYHGIKNKRSGGMIIVRGSRIGADRLQIEIEDNGIGMPPAMLDQIRAQLNQEATGSIVAETGYGINNVNQRVKLYYGTEYGLSIESEHLHGTRVSLVVPLLRQSEPDSDR